ncbi:MAG: tryptophan synthase subunit alpha [Chthoniobacteraceae bacterium]
MSRIKACFATLKENRRKALVPFVTAGDPSLDATVPLLHLLAENGADLIELGIPFSDPMADGPVIQLADERALANGVTTIKILEMVREFRKTNSTTPIVLMGYLNPVEIYGYAKFAKDAAAAGVDGMIVVDLPPESSKPLTDEFDKAGIDCVFLLAPTTKTARIEKIAKSARGYLYYVSVKGVTGAGNLDVDAVNEKLETIRKITDLPITVGFGIKDGATARLVGQKADGVVVGSALVKLVEQHQQDRQALHSSIAAFMQSLRQGIDQ